jgi:hypothetical protein
MAIYEVTSTEVVQRCAKCGAENRIAIAGLTAGAGSESQTDARVIALPTCPTCRSTEFLIRSQDDEPEYPAQGSFGHLHRMLVDSLHAALVKADKVAPSLRDKQGRTDQSLAKPLTPAQQARFFPRGMKIEPPAAERPQPGEPPPIVPVPGGNK